MVDAVILAGSHNTGPLRECSEASNEAFIKIGSRTMIEYVVESLQNCRSIGKIVVVGPVEDLKAVLPAGDLLFAEPGETAIATLLNGINLLPDSSRVLVATSDVPLLTPEVLEEFLGYCGDQSVDFFYPIVGKEVVEARFPEVKRTYVALREGIFTGGNIFLVNAEVVKPCAAKAEAFVAARKSPFHLSILFGVTFMLKFLLKRLTIPELEKKFSQILGIRARAFICPCAEIGFDVDKPSDLELARKYL